MNVKPEITCGIFTYLSQSGCGTGSFEVGQQASVDPRFWELLMGFDLDGQLPEGAVVESATFNLRQEGTLTTDGDLSVWGLWTPVNETTAADVAATGTFNSEIVEDEATVTSPWTDWDVTDLVNSWLTGVEPDYGLAVGADFDHPENGARGYFYGLGTGAGYEPYLSIEYTVPPTP